MSSSSSTRSGLTAEWNRTPSPRFFQRVDESEEYNMYDLDDSLTSSSYLTSSSFERFQEYQDYLAYNETRRTLDFSEDDKSVGSKTRRIPRHLFPSIAMAKGVGIGPKMTEAESSRQAYVDKLVASRPSSVSTCSNADTFVFTNDDDSVVTIVERPTRKRGISMAFLESEFGQMAKRVTKNSVLQCVSCSGQHLVDATDVSRTCVFCGHSVLDEVDANVPEHNDDC
jgi:hypothetical protein